MKILKKTQTQLIVEKSVLSVPVMGLGTVIAALATIIQDFSKLRLGVILIVLGLIAVVVGFYLPEVITCDFNRETNRLTIAQKTLRTLLRTEVTQYPLDEIVSVKVNAYKSEVDPYETVEIVLISDERININFTEPGNQSSLNPSDRKVAEEISAFLGLNN